MQRVRARVAARREAWARAVERPALAPAVAEARATGRFFVTPDMLRDSGEGVLADDLADAAQGVICVPAVLHPARGVLLARGVEDPRIGVRIGPHVVYEDDVTAALLRSLHRSSRRWRR